MESGSAAAPDQHGERAPARAGGDERKLATVLFADLVGSTELAGSEDPERVRALLDRFYDAMAAEVEAAGGTVEKFAGDAVMAAFGAPAALEDHAERALHGALAMQRRLEELFGERLALRIGVNTGEVVVGRPREGSSFVTGDAVNVAARLEQAAEPGEILAGERTVASVRGAFEFDEPRKVEAKGKPGGVTCRRLVRALSLMRPRGVSGLQTAFVGRDEELEALQEAYRRVATERQPHLVTVLGEAGVGKTRLAREFWGWLATQDQAPLRRAGRCLSYRQATTYWALAEVLKEHFGLREDDGPETVQSRLGDRRILGLTLGLDVARDLHPLAARDRLHDAWVELVDELAAERPTVVLVEDLHWAEDELLDLLELLLRRVRGPLLLLATARPELLDARPGWGGAKRAATTLELEPLSAADTGRMLEELLAVELPPPVRAVVVERAEGNPFFVEELVATLIDRGVLERVNGRWEARAVPEGFAVPDSVQAVLAARIDLLPPPEKAALQAAAVIGRVFWTGPVYELLPGVQPDFDTLEERDFIRRRAGSALAGEREYVIKHALTREVAYESLPKAKRARLHAAFAEWLERAGGGRDEHASLLAHHYAEAVRPEEADLAWAGLAEEHARLREHAVVWLRRAAELAVGRYEVDHALALLERALALETATAGQIVILRQMADAHVVNYEVDRFRAAVEQALSLAPDRAVAAELYAELAHYGLGRPYMWKTPPAADVGERWREQALELADPGTEAHALALLATVLATPEAEEAADAAARVLTTAKELDSARLRRYAYEAHVLVASAAGRFLEACDWIDRALAEATTLSDPGDRFHQCWQAGFVYLRGGRAADVPPLVEECDGLAARLTPHDEVHAVTLRALLASVRGDWRALARLSERAQAASAANTETPCQFNWRSLLVCALGLAHLGEELGAGRLEERAREGAVVAGPPEREPALLRLALLRGDLEAAVRILERLPVGVDPWGVDAAAARLDALTALGDRARVEEEAAPFLAEESYTRPFALRALGLVRGRRALVEEALAGFEAQGLDWQASETRALLARPTPGR
jgi:class 3 adenylate cyclase